MTNDITDDQLAADLAWCVEHSQALVTAEDHLKYICALRAARTRIAELEGIHTEAMVVLSPSMPESGLVDACRQRQQAFISARDNSNVLEQRMAEVERERDEERTIRNSLAHQLAEQHPTFDETNEVIRLKEDERQLRRVLHELFDTLRPGEEEPADFEEATQRTFQAVTDLRRQLDEAWAVLRWLDQLGGLGLDKHERIRAVLAAARRVEDSYD